MSQERNEELTGLDLELAKMAQETPEMPADFHARWTEAVRAEAAGQQTEKKHEARRQWRYLLSAAAVFVFLIGGTLLTRSGKNGSTVKQPAAPEAAAVETGAPGDTDAEEAEANGEILFMQAARKETARTEGVDSGDAAAAPGAQANYAAEAEAVYEDGMQETDAYEYAPMYEAAEAYEDAAYDMAAEYEEDAAYEAAAFEEMSGAKAVSAEREEPAAAGNGAQPVYTAAVTAAPEATPKPTAVPTAEPAEELTEAPAEEAEPEAEPEADGFGGFMKDLGIFTLKTLAVAAAGAALAFLAACILRALKKRKQ